MSKTKIYNIHQLCRALGIKEAYYGLQLKLKKCGISHSDELDLTHWLNLLGPMSKKSRVAERIVRQINSL